MVVEAIMTPAVTRPIPFACFLPQFACLNYCDAIICQHQSNSAQQFWNLLDSGRDTLGFRIRLYILLTTPGFSMDSGKIQVFFSLLFPNILLKPDFDSLPVKDAILK